MGEDLFELGGYAFAESAFKHGVYLDQIVRALSHIVGEVTHRRSDEFRLWIGMSRDDQDGQPLEIGVIDWDGQLVVIHAMRLRRNWRRYLMQSPEQEES